MMVKVNLQMFPEWMKTFLLLHQLLILLLMIGVCCIKKLGKYFLITHFYNFLNISIFRPGKVCSFCNLGERSQLGQGSLLRLNWEKEFKSTLDEFIKQLVTKQLTPMPLQSPTAEMTPIVQYRRQKSAAKFK